MPTPPQDPPAQDPPALATIDLSGGDETPIQTAGRVVGGLVLMIVGAAGALGFGAAWLLGWLVPAIADWVELLGDILLIPAGLGLGLAVVGFELVRRGRKARAKEAAEAAALMASLSAADAASPPQERETHL